MTERKATPVELAYGLLWMQITKDKDIHDARRLIAFRLSKDAKIRGIEAAKTLYGEPDILEMCHD